MIARNLFAIVIVLAVGPALADEPPSTWTKAPLGGWVIVERQETNGDRKKDEKFKLVKTKEVLEPSRTWAVDRFNWKESDFDTTRFSQSGFTGGYILTGEGEKIRTEDLVIDGAKYPCVVRKYEWGKSETQAGLTVQFWVHDRELSAPRNLDLPGLDLWLGANVLRAEIQGTRGETKISVTLDTKSLQAVRTVGNKKITCIQEEMKQEVERPTMKSIGKLTSWSAAEVPGWTVFQEGEADTSRGKGSFRFQVVDFGQ